MVEKKYYLIILLFFLVAGSTAFSQQDTIVFTQSVDSIILKEYTDSVRLKIKIDSSRAIRYQSLDSIAKIRAMLIDSIIDYGKTFVGLKYKYGGITPAGFDCSGFVFHIHRHFNLPMPRVPSVSCLMGRRIPQDSLQPGDLVYIKTRSAYDNTIGHVMMVIEKTDDSFIVIHSASHAGLVIEDFKTHDYYVSRYLFANRLPDEFYLRQWNDSLMDLYKVKNADLYHESTAKIVSAQQPEGTVQLNYTVKSGDAVSLIASWYGVNTAELMAWNGLGSYSLKLGQVMKVYVPQSLESKYKVVNNLSFEDKQKMVGINPATNTKVEEKIDTTYEYYTVKSGDNPYNISKKYPGISADDIMKLNGITNPSSLRIGQKLKIKKK